MAALTTIAAGASLAATATSAGLSFGQAAKQRKLQRAAEADADRAMAAARGKLDVNFAEQMAIKKEAYDLEREAMLVQGAQLTQAGIESERGSAATAGRIFAQQQLGQQQIRSAMADEMTNIESAVLEEESRLRDLGVGLDLEEIAGQQMRAADAQRAATASTQQGIQSAVSAVGQGIEFGVPLYRKTRADKLARKKAELYNVPTVKASVNTATPGIGTDQTPFTTAPAFTPSPYRTPSPKNSIGTDQSPLTTAPVFTPSSGFEINIFDPFLQSSTGRIYDPIIGKYKY